MQEEKFRFKKFDIRQNEQVHKVGTDGVLLGAWVDVGNVKRILDIGTGTGLIALMLAQRSSLEVIITAIESHSDTFSLAKQNIEESPFAKRIQLVHKRLQDYESEFLFDLVVCNPPFFINSLKPPLEHRKRQRHSDDLTFDQILTGVTTLLSPTGRLAVILPITEGNRFMSMAQNFGLSVSRQFNVYSKEGKDQERFLLEFSYRTIRLQRGNLTLMKIDGSWTEEYKSLTGDFYLSF